MEIEELKLVVGELCSAVDEWREQQGPMATFAVGGRSFQIEVVSEAIQQLSSDLFEAVEQEDWPEDAWELVLASEQYRDQWNKWVDSWTAESGQGIFRLARGTSDLWYQLEVVRKCLDPPPGRVVETIDQLVAQKLSNLQIAKIYGWRTHDGQWDVAKVLQERREPGRHVNDGFIPREELDRQADLKNRWLVRQARLALAAAEKKMESEPPPESLDDLIDQRVTAKQILKMIPGITLDDILAAAGEAGVMLPDHPNRADYRQAMEARPSSRVEREQMIDEGQQAQYEQQQELESYDDIPDMEDRIAAMAEDGLKAQPIADLLKDTWPELTRQKVSAIIKRRQAAMADGG